MRQAQAEARAAQRVVEAVGKMEQASIEEVAWLGLRLKYHRKLTAPAVGGGGGGRQAGGC